MHKPRVWCSAKRPKLPVGNIQLHVWCLRVTLSLMLRIHPELYEAIFMYFT